MFAASLLKDVIHEYYGENLNWKASNLSINILKIIIIKARQSIGTPSDIDLKKSYLSQYVKYTIRILVNNKRA